MKTSILALCLTITVAQFFSSTAFSGGKELQPGDEAPAFSAKNQDGKLIRLSDLQGKNVLLFFYPKDDTPGCTKEACQFRDQYLEIKNKNTEIFGVSRQDAESHRKFKAKHKLPFDLLLDQDGIIAKAYGISTIPIIGFFERKSVLIGPDGHIVRFYLKVDPHTHAAEVLKDL